MTYRRIDLFPRMDGPTLVASLRMRGFKGKIIVHADYLSEEQREQFGRLAVDFVFQKGEQSRDFFSTLDRLAAG